MTDKEMAEESLISYRKEPKWAGKMFMQDENTCYKDGFLAGLKAGNPKWHKVVDGDLPKEQKEYWCMVFFYESEETFNAFLWFDPNTKDFKFLEEIEKNVGSTFNVKAWCEMPKYTEDIEK